MKNLDLFSLIKKGVFLIFFHPKLQHAIACGHRMLNFFFSFDNKGLCLFPFSGFLLQAQEMFYMFVV